MHLAASHELVVQTCAPRHSYYPVYASSNLASPHDEEKSDRDLLMPGMEKGHSGRDLPTQSTQTVKSHTRPCILLSFCAGLNTPC